MARKQTIESKVKHILAMDEESRNDDIRLTQMYWWNYHRDLITMQNDTAYIALKNLHKLPSQDGIKRVRAHIQNDLHKYVPTRKDVAMKRLKSEELWRQYLGYPTGDTL